MLGKAPTTSIEGAASPNTVSRTVSVDTLMSGDSSVESALQNAETFGLDGEKLIHNRLDLNNTVQMRRTDKKLPKFAASSSSNKLEYDTLSNFRLIDQEEFWDREHDLEIMYRFKDYMQLELEHDK